MSFFGLLTSFCLPDACEACEMRMSSALGLRDLCIYFGLLRWREDELPRCVFVSLV